MGQGEQVDNEGDATGQPKRGDGTDGTARTGRTRQRSGKGRARTATATAGKKLRITGRNSGKKPPSEWRRKGLTKDHREWIARKGVWLKDLRTKKNLGKFFWEPLRMTKTPETRCQCGKEPYRTTAGRKTKPSGMPMNKGKKKVRKKFGGYWRDALPLLTQTGTKRERLRTERCRD